MTSQPKKIIISGGGTGGHVFPAIAIANAIKSIAPDTDILFVGAKGKLEMEKVPKAGYPIEGLWISGLQRKLSLKNFAFPFKLISSMIRARSIIKRFRPDVAVGVGGYASGPTLRAAAKMGVPTLIQEQNGYAGMTNKLLAKKTSKICVAYDNMERFFPKEKIILTGNPVREDIAHALDKKGEAYAHFGLNPNKKTLVLLGGSLGARTINEAISQNAGLIKKEDNLQVLWQCGKLYEAEFTPSEAAQLSNVKMTAFIDRMDLLYAIADVIISRAGALAISELCLVGKPVLLIPSPNVAEDHQTKNAQALASKNAAILIKDSEAREQAIPEAIKLIKDTQQQETMKNNIIQLARPNAAVDIAAEVLKLARQ